MRQIIKSAMGTIGYPLPMKVLMLLSGQKLILPFYHAVSDDPAPHLRNAISVPPVKEFIGGLEYLLRHYRAVGLEELKEAGTGKVMGKPMMFLSFDDGLSEIYQTAAPVLRQKGIPAAFFVNTAFIGNRDLFYRYKASLLIDRLSNAGYPKPLTGRLQERYGVRGTDRNSIRQFISGIPYAQKSVLDEIAEMLELDFKTYLKQKKPYMDLEQLRELSGYGFYIGSHGIDHAEFGGLKPQERIRQYTESITYIKEELGLDYRIFSFPFTDYGIPASFFRQLEAEYSLDASFGTAGIKKDPLHFHFQRMPMEEGGMACRKRLKAEYLYYLLKGFAGKNSMIRDED